MHREGEDMPKILIVEDNVDIREFLRCSLEESGFGVIAVGDGADALLSVLTFPKHSRPLVTG